MKEQFELKSLLLRLSKNWTTKKNAVREFLQGQNVLLNLPTGFPASSNRCRCTAVYSVVQPTVLVQEIMIFTDKRFDKALDKKKISSGTQGMHCVI